MDILTQVKLPDSFCRHYCVLESFRQCVRLQLRIIFMKLATCSVDDRKFIGIVDTENSKVFDISSEYNDMALFLQDRVETLQSAAADISESSESFPLNEVQFHAPLMPGKLFCMAGNYQKHIEELHEKMEKQDKETPRVFMKPPTNTVIGNGDDIIIPKVGRAIDWEGELAVVMGKTAKLVKAENALEYVAGYTIMNDVSERDLKIWNRSSNRPKDEWFDWLNGKWCDTFAPLGPWIVTTDEITDPHNLVISTYVNGECKQNNSTSDMLIKIPELIEYITSFITLSPGDVISTGTIAGVGASSGEFLKAGDKVKISITEIGELDSGVRDE